MKLGRHRRINWDDVNEVAEEIYQKYYNGYCIMWIENKKLLALELTTA